MQSIGTIAERAQAALFQEYLETRGVEATIDTDDGTNRIWVYDYDQVPVARTEFQRFQAATDRTLFEQAVLKFRSEEKLAPARDVRKNRPALTKSKSESPFVDQIPVTLALAAVCIGVGIMTVFGTQNIDLIRSLRISAAPPAALATPDAQFVNFGRIPEIGSGHVWRLVTPIFLHGSLAHLFFNIVWLVPLGGAIEYRRGSLKFAGIVIGIAVISNVAQYFATGPYFQGISGVDAGLFGYLLVVGCLQPEDGIGVDLRTSFLMVAYLGICLTPLVPAAANWSHFVGLAAGAGFAALGIALSRAGHVTAGEPSVD